MVNSPDSAICGSPKGILLRLTNLKKADLVEAAEGLLKDRRWPPAVLRSTEAEDISVATDAEALDRVR
jgi:hypothetical protein